MRIRYPTSCPPRGRCRSKTGRRNSRYSAIVMSGLDALLELPSSGPAKRYGDARLCSIHHCSMFASCFCARYRLGASRRALGWATNSKPSISRTVRGDEPEARRCRPPPLPGASSLSARAYAGRRSRGAKNGQRTANRVATASDGASFAATRGGFSADRASSAAIQVGISAHSRTTAAAARRMTATRPSFTATGA
jgi:hypothetical protein